MFRGGCLIPLEKSGKVFSRDKDQPEFWSTTRQWGEVKRAVRKDSEVLTSDGFNALSTLLLYKVSVGEVNRRMIRNEGNA